MPEGRPHKAKAAPPRSDVHPSAGRGALSESVSFSVVGIGASAGGLDACRRFLRDLPPRTGMAFILVQHLDPSHESMMADLLSSHTAMTVRQAADGMPIERNHLYLIPTGT